MTPQQRDLLRLRARLLKDTLCILAKRLEQTRAELADLLNAIYDSEKSDGQG